MKHQRRNGIVAPRGSVLTANFWDAGHVMDRLTASSLGISTVTWEHHQAWRAKSVIE